MKLTPEEYEQYENQLKINREERESLSKAKELFNKIPYLKMRFKGGCLTIIDGIANDEEKAEKCDINFTVGDFKEIIKRYQEENKTNLDAISEEHKAKLNAPNPPE